VACNELLLSSYIDKELSPVEERKLTGHLKECASCRKELGCLLQTRKLFALKERKNPDEYFETRILAGIRAKLKEEQQLAGRPFYGKFMPVTIPVAVVLVLFVFGVMNQKTKQGPVNVQSDINNVMKLNVDKVIDQDFDKELIDLYYNSFGQEILK